MTDARIWIGPAGAGDRLDLATVLAAIQPDANSLRDSLQTDRIKGLFRMRSEASQLAAEAQNRFKRLSAVAVSAPETVAGAVPSQQLAVEP